ncbi:hypothetical protein Tdes44962_MAKER05486 [Teratosphaeria destructans]|uniref:Uncharacterized protein n=1 Tax=Teratosphaeria destructans TaxID=418781 RepID=A0A9W7VZ31_9PEZI|nr:hypothetical protein Tdes44962_MAKER05486 [Teratosphaeria destructans]
MSGNSCEKNDQHVPEQVKPQHESAGNDTHPAPRPSRSIWSLRSAIPRRKNTKSSKNREDAVDVVQGVRQYKPRHAGRDALLCAPRQARDRSGSASESGAASQHAQRETDPVSGSSSLQLERDASNARFPLPAVKSAIPRPEELGLSYQEWKKLYPYTYIASAEDQTNQPFRRSAPPSVVARPTVTVGLPEDEQNDRVHISLSRSDLAILLRDNPNIDWKSSRVIEHSDNGRNHAASAVEPAATSGLSAKALGKRPVFETRNSPPQDDLAVDAARAEAVPIGDCKVGGRGLAEHMAAQRKPPQARQQIGGPPSSTAGESWNSPDQSCTSKASSLARAKVVCETPPSSCTPSVTETALPDEHNGPETPRAMGKVFELGHGIEDLSLMDDEMREWAKNQEAWLGLDGEEE